MLLVRRRLLSGAGDKTLRVWDAESGRCLFISVHFPPGEEATLNGESRRIVWAGPGAWRHLGWRVYDTAAGRTRILPAEFFGSLPG